MDCALGLTTGVGLGGYCRTWCKWDGSGLGGVINLGETSIGDLLNVCVILDCRMSRDMHVVDGKNGHK